MAYSPYLTSDEMRADWEEYSASHGAWIEPQYFPHQIWKDNSVGQSVVAPENEAPYLPSWQMSPLPADANSIVNFDYGSTGVYQRTLQSLLINEKKAALSEPFDAASLFGASVPALQENEESSTTSLLLTPVLSTLDPSQDASVVGFLSTIVPWNVFFQGALREGQEGVIAVVESCGTAYATYALNGPNVEKLGDGDLHDRRFNAHVQSAIINGSPEDGKDTCQHKIHVYPLSSLKGSSGATAHDATVLTAVVVAVVVVGAILFAFYDYYLRRSYRLVVESAGRAEAIVNHLIPQNIGAQHLLQSKDLTPAAKTLDNDTSEGESSDVLTGPSLEQLPTKDALMKYVSTSNRMDKTGKPLAELFPDATVLFADIAGFTAWSSIREPSQVFTLLESIFGSFDAIAGELGVFKVETVGDCYVAVCGLPEPNKDHALVMCNFARQCMEKVNEVIRELELTLGPDTAELAMRFGIHSGPITAGVLRGDRARFQLFGDTVNTAARIESNGLRNRIHLSEQTASLIMATGRKEWVSEREDAIEAKGKGTMKTYWLLTLRAAEKASSEADDEEDKEGGEGGDEQEYVPKASFMQRIAAMKESRASKERRIQRLVQWNSEMLVQLLKQVVARRQVLQRRKTSQAALSAMAGNIGSGTMIVEEVAEIITLPEFDAQACAGNATSVCLPEKVVEQVHSYVGTVAGMYRDNPFHNFEHASHVTMSVSKLLSRIVAPEINGETVSDDDAARQAALHDHTYGITSDPLTQFAVVLSALIHDIDHRGVPNFILNEEDENLAAAYKNKSTAEQNSVDLAWKALLADDFEDLRSAIFGNISELRRFRQLLVNSVIATDIFDKELGAARKARWEKAFSEEFAEDHRTEKNRKATIVIEHLIQASDVAHTMQHWHVYTKWNEKLFQEMYDAYKIGRSKTDPSINWYQGEIGFLDNYVIPLAKKLKNCGVFGVASDEYLNYAQENRREWGNRGQDIVASYIEKHGVKPEKKEEDESESNESKSKDDE